MVITELIELKDEAGKISKEWTAGGQIVPRLTQEDRQATNVGKVYQKRHNFFPDPCYYTTVKSNSLDPRGYEVEVRHFSSRAAYEWENFVGFAQMFFEVIIDWVIPILDGYGLLKIGISALRKIFLHASAAMKAVKTSGKAAAEIQKARYAARNEVIKEAGEEALAAKNQRKQQREIDSAAVRAAEEAVDNPASAPRPSAAPKSSPIDLAERNWNILERKEQDDLRRLAAAIVQTYDPFELSGTIGFNLEAELLRAEMRMHLGLVTQELVRTRLNFDAAADLAKKLASNRGVGPRQTGLPGGMFRPGGSPTGGQKGAGYYDEIVGSGSSRNDPNTSNSPSLNIGNKPNTSNNPNTSAFGTFFKSVFKAAPDVIRLNRDVPPVATKPREEILDYFDDIAERNPNPNPSQPRVIDGLAASVSAIKAVAGEKGARDVQTVFKDPEILPDLLAPNTDRAAHTRIAEKEFAYWSNEHKKNPSPGTQAAVNQSVAERVSIQQGMADLMQGWAAGSSKVRSGH